MKQTWMERFYSLISSSEKGNVSRSLSLQQTSTLMRACLISHGGTINVQFEVGEKLTIMFMYKKKYAVYRKSDGAIAVLSNAEFQGTPTAMLDGSKYGPLLSNVELMLIYAVAKVDFSDKEGFRFWQNDVILILAHCNDTFVGISARKKVGFFQSDLVQTITKPRLCIFKGMVLKMTAVIDSYYEKLYEGLTYEITKSPEGLFSWSTEDGQGVPLYALAELEDNRAQHLYENETYLLSLKNERALPQPPMEDHLSDGRVSWFHGILSRDEAEKLLHKNGDFLVRYKTSEPGIYVLSCKTVNGYEHFKLALDQTSHYITRVGQFKSIESLIQFHQSSLAPISRDPATIICRPVKSVGCLEGRDDKHYQEITSNDKDDDLSKGASSPTEIYKNEAIEESHLCGQENTMAFEGKKDIVKVLIETFDSTVPQLNTPVMDCSQQCIPTRRDDNLKQPYCRTLFDLPESSEDVHVYDEPDEGLLRNREMNMLAPPEEIEQRRPRSPLTIEGRFVFSQLCRMEKQISDLKSHFQSITLSQTLNKEDDTKREKGLLETLEPFQQMEVNNGIYCAVAEYLEGDLFHEVGKMLGIHKNRRTQIEKNKEDIVQRTIDLLDQWHKKEGQNATLGKLVDVLKEFNPEDMVFILEELCEEVKTREDIKEVSTDTVKT